MRISLGRYLRPNVRLDPPYDAGESEPEAVPKPESSWLRELLRKAIHASDRDRRGAIRHDVVDREVWLGWWFDDDFGAVNGRLVNLSRSGAMVVLGQKPPRKQPIWMYKEIDDAVVCVRSDLVGVSPAPGGSYTARLRFAVPCPTSFCVAALCGPRPGRSRKRTNTALKLPNPPKKM